MAVHASITAEWSSSTDRILDGLTAPLNPCP